jgi:hypothetical protein
MWVRTEFFVMFAGLGVQPNGRECKAFRVSQLSDWFCDIFIGATI